MDAVIVGARRLFYCDWMHAEVKAIDEPSVSYAVSSRLSNYLAAVDVRHSHPLSVAN